MRHTAPLLVFFALSIVMLVSAASMVLGDEPNVGILKISDLTYPKQVAPSAVFSLVIQVEYAVRFNATIKSALFDGSRGRLGKQLWQSSSVTVVGGGDKDWSVNLSAPAMEGQWALTAFAYFSEGGKWRYYNDTTQGPGVAEIAVKVSKYATLQVNLGIPDVPVTIDNSTQESSSDGSVLIRLPVGMTHQVEVSPFLEFKNATRLAFLGWIDGDNSTRRTLKLDGDMVIAGTYKTQYLLRVDSVIQKYSFSEWRDAESNVTLGADDSFPAEGLPALVGLKYVFKGWTGAANATSNRISFVMNGPKTVSANYALDYTPLVLPTIIAVGIVGGIILFVLRRRAESRAAKTQEEAAKTPEEAPTTQEVEEAVNVKAQQRQCESCGEPVEEGWTHCIQCGKPLASSEPVKG